MGKFNSLGKIVDGLTALKAKYAVKPVNIPLPNAVSARNSGLGARGTAREAIQQHRTLREAIDEKNSMVDVDDVEILRGGVGYAEGGLVSLAQKYANGGEVDLSKPFIGYPNLPQPRQPRQPRASIDTIKASPQSPLFGSVARGLRSLQEMASKYEVNPRIPLLGGTGVDELLALPGAASLMEDISYQGPRALIRGGNAATGGLGTFKLDPRTTDLLDVGATAAGVGQLGVLAGRGVNKAAMAAGQAGARYADRVVPQIMDRGGYGSEILQGLAQGSRSNIVKEPGGQWLKGSVEDAVRGLKAPLHPGRAFGHDANAIGQAYGLDPGEVIRSANPRTVALNTWIDKNLTNYIKKEMATPTDPVRLGIERRVAAADKTRALAEKEAVRQEAWATKLLADGPKPGMAAGIFDNEVAAAGRRAARTRAAADDAYEAQVAGAMHMNVPDRPTVGSRVVASRMKEGFPQMGVSSSKSAQEWENLADSAVTPYRPEYTSKVLADNPWLATVAPETKVFNVDWANNRMNDFGFPHLADEMRIALSPNSPFPQDLRLKYLDLPNLSVDAAVAKVGQINAWRAAQKAELNMGKANNPATVLYKEYPDDPRGLRWMELKAPEKTGKNVTVNQTLEDPMFEIPMAQQNRFNEQAHREATRQGIVDEDDLMDFVTTRQDELSQMWAKANPTKKQADESEKALLEAMQYEGDTMKHCIAGDEYCEKALSGDYKYYSLRDAKGEPHATIEVGKGRPMVRNPEQFKRFSELSPEQHSRFEEYSRQMGNAPGLSKLEDTHLFNPKSGTIFRTEEVFPLEQILQIKGKLDKKPVDKYIPYVQDFVRSGKWGDVGDLEHTDLTYLGPKSGFGQKAASDFGVEPGYFTAKEFNDLQKKVIDALPPEGFAAGGLVSDNEYNSDTVDDIVSQFKIDQLVEEMYG